MKNRKIAGRQQSRKLKKLTKRSAATMLALMITTGSFGSVTAYAEEVTVDNGKMTTTESSQSGTEGSQTETDSSQSSTGEDQSGASDSQSTTPSDQTGAGDSQAGSGEGQQGTTDDQSDTETGQTQDDGSTANPYASLERPSQSETVEIIPGIPSDTKKDEEDTMEEGKTDGSAVGTTASPDTNTESGVDAGSGDANENAGITSAESEEKNENDGTGAGTDVTGNSRTQGDGGTEGTAGTGGVENTGNADNAGSAGSTESTTEQSGESEEAETESVTQTENNESATEKNYDYFYDEETGKFHVTFNIKEEAQGDQTVELSKVLEEISLAGKAEFDKYLETPEGKEEYEEARRWSDKYLKHTFNGVTYVLDLDSKSKEVNVYNEPGCTTVFDVYITNGSNHTYVYKDQSFVVATPDVTNDDKTGMIGFDGQEVPKEYSETMLSLGFNKDQEDDSVINHLVDEALKEYPIILHPYYYVDSDGELTKDVKRQTFSQGTSVEKIGSYYYVKVGDYYVKVSSSNVQNKKDNGQVTYSLKKEVDATTNAYILNGKSMETLIYEKVLQRSDSTITQREVKNAVDKYMDAHNYTYESYILDYFNNRDNTAYQEIKELVLSNNDALKELAYYTVDLNERIDTKVPYKYNNFYKNILSFNVGDSETMQEFLDKYKTNEKEDLHDDGYWSFAGTQLTIGDYMADQLNKTDGAWEKANEYFNALTASGITKEEATWAAFTMATNIDGKYANNNYQNTAWSWYSSLVLKQQDGTLNLTKVDAKGNVLGDDEGEEQTSFYLWTVDKKTETAADGTQETTDVTKYCVYVDPVYETVKNDDGTESQKLVKDGYYGWVEYDPDNKALNYTISTTNGTLNIDYALLEGMIYYLQEKAAPDGYDVDSNIYVICDEAAYKKMIEEKGAISVVNPATGVESTAVHLGAIKGGETLNVKLINRKTVVVPDPTPTSTPTSVTDNGGSDGETPEIEPGKVLGVQRAPENKTEESIEEPDMVLGAERLPKTGDTGADAPVMMLGFGLIAALYAWFSGKREKNGLK